MEPSQDPRIARVHERRERHRRRPLPVRVLVATGGFVLGVVSIPPLLILPEIGLPMMLAALGILALEFDWAARALAWVIVQTDRLRAWFGRQPRVIRWAIVIAAVAILVGLIWLFVT